MSWQAQLFIGERVHNYTEVRAILAKIGATHDITGQALARGQTPNRDLSDGRQFLRRTLRVRDHEFEVHVSFMIELEGGVGFPVPVGQKYSDAVVGFALTSRYRGAILDVNEPHGRPEPFEIDVDALADLLRQTREWWPDAQVLIWDRHY